MLAYITSIVFAFQPPTGWVEDESGSFLFQAEHREKGEIFQISTETKALYQLAFALMDNDLDLIRGTYDPYGNAKLTFSDREAVAKWSGKDSKWIVLLYQPKFASLHNFDALLADASDNRTDPLWAKGKAKNWLPEAEGATWGKDAKLTGLWLANGRVNGIPLSIEIQFENNGSFRMEKKSKDKRSVTSGHWVTSNGKLQLQYKKKNTISDYRHLGRALQFEIDNVTLIFHRQ